MCFDIVEKRWAAVWQRWLAFAKVWTTLCNVGEGIASLDHVAQRYAALHNLGQRCTIAGERWEAIMQRFYNVAKKLPNVITYAAVGSRYITDGVPQYWTKAGGTEPQFWSNYETLK